MELDLNAPEVQEAVKAAAQAEAEKIKAQLEAEYSGLKSNKDAILAEKKALAEELNSFKSQFEGMDINQVKTMLENVRKDQHAALIAEGKWDEVIAQKTEAMRRDYETKLGGLDQELKKYQSEAEKLVEEKKRYMVDMRLREAGSKYVYPEMMEFLQERAREVFRLEEDGQVVARTKDGTLLLGPDGKSPLNMESWVLMQKDKYPYIFQQSSGSGSSNSVKGKGGVKYKEDLSNPAAKAKYIGEHGMDAYLNLPNKA